MPSRPAPATQANIARALKAGVAAGLSIGGWEITSCGTVRVWVAGQAPAAENEAEIDAIIARIGK